METAKLIVRLPKQDLEFAERYARARRITVSELVDRYIRHLRGQSAAQVASSRRRQSEEAWSEFFRAGDALAAGDAVSSESLTAAVLAMRR